MGLGAACGACASPEEVGVLAGAAGLAPAAGAEGKPPEEGPEPQKLRRTGRMSWRTWTWRWDFRGRCTGGCEAPQPPEAPFPGISRDRYTWDVFFRELFLPRDSARSSRPGPGV